MSKHIRYLCIKNMMECWISTNSGDYVELCKEGRYMITLLSRIDEWTGAYIHGERFEITALQFKSLKGFVPIKPKKLQTRIGKHGLNGQGRFRPTLEDGMKGTAKRTEVPTLQEAREMILRELGL